MVWCARLPPSNLRQLMTSTGTSVKWNLANARRRMPLHQRWRQSSWCLGGISRHLLNVHQVVSVYEKLKDMLLFCSGTPQVGRSPWQNGDACGWVNKWKKRFLQKANLVLKSGWDVAILRCFKHICTMWIYFLIYFDWLGLGSVSILPYHFDNSGWCSWWCALGQTIWAL